MQYATGSIGRVVLARFDHGEPIVPALADLCRREGIASGWFFLFGAAAGGRLVAGPKDAVLPPEPAWEPFAAPHEIVGMGSIAAGDGEPAVHLHAALGRGREVLAGCIREEGDVHIVVEALVMELSGVRASRRRDPATGVEVLSVG